MWQQEKRDIESEDRLFSGKGTASDYISCLTVLLFAVILVGTIAVGTLSVGGM